MDRSDLEYIRILNDKINFHLERIAYLKSKAFPGAIRYDSIGGSRAMVFDSLGEIYAEIDAEERKVDKLTDQYAAQRSAAIQAIRQLTTRRERNILYIRYIAFKSWHEVENIVNKRDKCSMRTIMNIHNDALRKLN